ncbi:MAG: sigma-E factor negative regulatory protein [Halioglobus sp.]
MSEQLRESLSALMDDEANELEVERLLREMPAAAELRQTWVRYHVARDALKGQRIEHSQIDLSVQVREAIAQEKPPLASTAQRLLRPVASFAVAASVAATVVLGGQQLSQLGNTGADQAGSAIAGMAPVGMVNTLGATPVRASYGSQAVPALRPANHTAYRELARLRLKQFGQAHAEQAALNTPQGLIPFARVPTIKQ